MSISEISAASALPVRRRARMSAMAASAFGLGALFIEVSSSSERPLTTGTWGITASGEAPRTRPSSSIQWRRPEWTSVNGRRSSTLMTIRFGNSRTTSARRTSGIASTRRATAPGSRRKRLVPGSTAAAARISAVGTREAPRTSTLTTAKRGVVRSQWAEKATASGAANASAVSGSTRRRRPRCRAFRRGPLPTRWRATNTERSPRSAARAAREPQATADEHGARGRVEGPVGEGAGGRLELAERAVRVQEVDGAHKIADPAIRCSGIHGERATDRGRNPDQAFDPAEVQGRGLADQRRQAHARADDRLLAVELGATETPLEPQHDAAHAPRPDQQVVAAADDRHGQLLALGEEQRVANVVDVLGDDEDVGGAADAERGVEAQRLFEPHFPADLS